MMVKKSRFLFLLSVYSEHMRFFIQEDSYADRDKKFASGSNRLILYESPLQRRTACVSAVCVSAVYFHASL
jgi:hypothetical protein